MSLAEILISALAPSIARMVLGRWLSADLTSDVSRSLVDLVKQKTRNVIAQQRAKRQFEAIGEEVALSLQPLFGEEAYSEAVAQAVANTLSQARLTPDLLAQQSLEPRLLAAALLEGGKNSTEGFSVEEYALYERILQETSGHVIEIASQLPSFTERTLGEILQREDQLLKVTRETLELVRNMRMASDRDNQTSAAAQFELEYRRELLRRLDVLELFGVQASAASRRHSLSIAYIMLQVQRFTAGYIQQAASKSKGRKKKNIQPARAADAIAQPVDKVLEEAARLLIRGEPGSGKTTLLQWIAVKAVSGTFEGRLQAWNDRIPFFIPLRSLAEQAYPAPEDFPRLGAPMTAGIMPPGWAHAQLASGRAIVLIDGVDEVRRSRRETVQDWLRDLTAAYPACIFVVTSRPSAVAEGWLAGLGFVDAQLLPMELDDIEAFIAHWHAAVRQELVDETEKDELNHLEAHLKQVLRTSPGLAELATSPLLCAMLCAVHRDNRQELPTDRVELYEVCSYALLEKRDLERRVELHDYPRLSYRQKKLIVQDLAYWMLKNGWARIHYGQALEQVQHKLTRMRELPANADAAAILCLLTERSGLIREPSQGELDFTHRTFQEYFAALAVVDENDLGLLVEKALDDQWREVVVLAAGVAPAKTRSQLIKVLLSYGRQQRGSRLAYTLLAVTCLQSTIEMAQTEQDRIRNALKQILPPQNEEQARALAGAGELAVTYLNPSPAYSESETAYCVRTLALIGSEGALEHMAGFASDERPQVVYELLRAGRAFEADTYQKLVLAQCKPEKFEMSSLNTPNILEYLPGLRVLSIPNSVRLNDLSPLAQMQALEEIDLSGCENVQDIGPLAKLKKLRRVVLAGCRQLADLTPLAGLENLETLDISETQVESLEVLKGIKCLASLRAADCQGLTDFSALPTLQNLQALDISHTRPVEEEAGQAGRENKPGWITPGSTFGRIPLIIDNSPLAQHRRGPHPRKSGPGQRYFPLDLLANLSKLRSLDVRGYGLVLFGEKDPILQQPLESLGANLVAVLRPLFERAEALKPAAGVQPSTQHAGTGEPSQHAPQALQDQEVGTPTKEFLERLVYQWLSREMDERVGRLMLYPAISEEEVVQLAQSFAPSEVAERLQNDLNVYNKMDQQDKQFIKDYYLPAQTLGYRPGQLTEWQGEMAGRLEAWSKPRDSYSIDRPTAGRGAFDRSTGKSGLLLEDIVEALSGPFVDRTSIEALIGQYVVNAIHQHFLERVEDEKLREALAIQEAEKRAGRFDVAAIGRELLEESGQANIRWLRYLTNKSRRMNAKLLEDYLDPLSLSANLEETVALMGDHLLVRGRREISPQNILMEQEKAALIPRKIRLVSFDTEEPEPLERFIVNGLVAQMPPLFALLPSAEALKALVLDDYYWPDLKIVERFTGLQTLRLAGCTELRSLDGIEHLEQLQALTIDDCPNLGSLQPLRALKNLRRLILRGCNLANPSRISMIISGFIPENKIDSTDDQDILNRLEYAEIVDTNQNVLYQSGTKSASSADVLAHALARAGLDKVDPKEALEPFKQGSHPLPPNAKRRNANKQASPSRSKRKKRY